MILPFTRAVRKFTHLSMPVNKALELMNLADGLKMALRYLPYLPGLRKWSRLSAADVAARCRNPLLRRTFLNLFLPEMSAFFLVLTMAWMNKKSGGYPLGGSLPFVHRIEERYLSLGGKIHFNSKVTSILVRKGQAKGVTLENGETLPAHAVISAADGHQTIFEMLEGKYLDDRVRAMYDTWDTFPPWCRWLWAQIAPLSANPISWCSFRPSRWSSTTRPAPTSFLAGSSTSIPAWRRREKQC